MAASRNSSLAQFAPCSRNRVRQDHRVDCSGLRLTIPRPAVVFLSQPFAVLLLPFTIIGSKLSRRENPQQTSFRKYPARQLENPKS
jgi:hypothetical protein